jgi:hypothetical protein
VKDRSRSGPWGYPCHSCAEAGRNGHVRLLLESKEVGDMPLPGGGFVRYAESDGYAWHTAGWDLLTGRWYAVCCQGHVVRGRDARV